MPGLTTDALQKPTIVTTQCEERPDTDISSLELDEPVFDAAAAHEAEQTRHEQAVDEKKGRFAVSTYSRRVLRGLRTRRHEADAGIIDRMWCSRCAGGCSRCSPWPSISTDKRRSECCAVVMAVFGPSSSRPRLALYLGTKMRCAHITAQCFLARLGFIASGTVAKSPIQIPHSSS